MHDLRRQALESGKTVSRKARSRQSTPASSTPNSSPPSRAASQSRAVSRASSEEDEVGDLSDETSFRSVFIHFAPASIRRAQTPLPAQTLLTSYCSTNSIDDLLNGDNPVIDAWRSNLADRIQELIDRKRSSVQGREKCLALYARILTAQYAEEEIRGKEAELVVAFLKSIKAETSERETILAIKGECNILKAATMTC